MDVNVNPTYPLFPVFSFISFFLVLIPLPWHIQAWNIGTCAYIIWASVGCLLEFINSVVWRNNTLNLAPVWCDISSKILLGAGVGIPAAGLCISRRLYIISAIKSTVTTHQDKRRAVIIDSWIAFGTPILVMALHYVVQGHRFDILEDVGCYPSYLRYAFGLLPRVHVAHSPRLHLVCILGFDIARLLQAPIGVLSISVDPQLIEHEPIRSFDDAGRYRNAIHNSY
ncbi:pheromone A receptor-domain-containing protein [Lanmaoa asiatica]|nr:pheromone A receptor-domain-containing protein [Lanmaoa asiatica]